MREIVLCCTQILVLFCYSYCYSSFFFEPCAGNLFCDFVDLTIFATLRIFTVIPVCGFLNPAPRKKINVISVNFLILLKVNNFLIFYLMFSFFQMENYDKVKRWRGVFLISENSLGYNFDFSYNPFV